MESHIEPARLRAAFGHFATGVAVITAAGESGQCAGMTINSFASLSLSPPLILWSIGKSSGSHSLFTAAAEFAIHVLRADQAQLSRQFSTPGADRFRGVAFECTPRGIPLLKDYHARILCHREHRYEGGDHTIIIGRVLEIDSQDGDPLVFYRGRLNRVREIATSPTTL
jgi:3-hydroxy-9,10-secoandrosta-1,3,5(10)-triene-9,17-dione monooxygenase reductase component